MAQRHPAFASKLNRANSVPSSRKRKAESDPQSKSKIPKHAVYLTPNEEEAFAIKLKPVRGTGKPFDDTINWFQNYLRHAYDLTEDMIQDGVVVKSASPDRPELDEEDRDGLTVIQTLVSFDGRTVDEKLNALFSKPQSPAESKRAIVLTSTAQMNHQMRANHSSAMISSATETKHHTSTSKHDIFSFRDNGMGCSRTEFKNKLSKWQEQGLTSEYIWRKLGGITPLMRDLIWLSTALYKKHQYIQTHPEYHPKGLVKKSCLRLSHNYTLQVYFALTSLYEHYKKGWPHCNTIVDIPRDLDEVINIKHDLTHHASWFAPYVKAPVQLACREFFNVIDEASKPHISVRFKSDDEMKEIIKQAKCAASTSVAAINQFGLRSTAAAGPAVSSSSSSLPKPNSR